MMLLISSCIPKRPSSAFGYRSEGLQLVNPGADGLDDGIRLMRG